MTRALHIVVVLLATTGLGCQATLPARSSSPAASSSWEVCFSPRGGCTDLVITAVREAKASILVQAYSFTSEPIARALVNAHTRGVSVEVIVDKSQVAAVGSQAAMAAHAGIPVRIDAAHAIAHNKVMVIDDHTVLTGSFNFTKAAEERNAENLLVIRDPLLVQRYRENWKRHEVHSELFTP